MQDRVMTKKELRAYNKALERELIKFRDELVPALEELRRNSEHTEELLKALRDDIQNRPVVCKR